MTLGFAKFTPNLRFLAGKSIMMDLGFSAYFGNSRYRSRCYSGVRIAKVRTRRYVSRHTPSGSTSIPWLNLRGRWLDNAGFHVNTPMTIHVMPGCIVLVAEDGGDNNTGKKDNSAGNNMEQGKAALKAAKDEDS